MFSKNYECNAKKKHEIDMNIGYVKKFRAQEF